MQWQAVQTDTPQSVQENDEHKILWDFNIQTDKVIEHKRPDIVCINKQKRECQIIDFAIPGDQNSHQRTGKNWQVPGSKNKITESLECQGSGHTGTYRCSQNYVDENTSVYKTEYPLKKPSYSRNTLYLTTK